MKKKAIIKRVLTPILVPVAKSYLKKERVAHFFGLRLQIPPGIFHPTLYFSTITMGKYLLSKNLTGINVIEIGCGSGALSLLAAQQGALVSCCDINEDAVITCEMNARKNKIKLKSVQSDLFESIEPQTFDLILNNPPYYPKKPTNNAEHAWYAGENYEYFSKLFQQAKPFLSAKGHILLVISDECHMELIHELAAKENYQHQLVFTRQTILEKTYIFQYNIRN